MSSMKTELSPPPDILADPTLAITPGIMPRTFEPGVYYSKANLPAPEEATDVISAYEANNPTDSRNRAIGMAALPDAYKSQQLTNLVYDGMTSEQYAARHAHWLEEYAYGQRLLNDIELNASEDDDDEDEGERKDRSPTGKISKKSVFALK